jgi:hypothetical protein
MIATVTIGKRRAGIPSERGSIEISLVGLRLRSIGEIADALREAGTFRSLRSTVHPKPVSVDLRTAGFPHGVSALSDSRSAPGGRESGSQINQEVYRWIRSSNEPGSWQGPS